MFHRPDTVERLHEAVIDLERSRRREHELRAVEAKMVDVARVLALAERRAPTFSALLVALRDVLPFGDATILVRGGDGVFVSSARTSEWLAALRLGPGRLHDRLVAGEVVTAFDASLVPEWAAQPPAVREQARSVLHAPLRTGAEAVVLVCTHAERARFSQRDVELVKGLIPLAGPILEKVQHSESLDAAGRDRRARLGVLAAIVDHLDAGVLVEDADRRWCVANDRLTALLAPATSVLGGDARELQRRLAAEAADPEAFLARVDALACARMPTPGERIVLADGRVLERDYVPVTTPDAGFLGHFWQYRER
jgi:PAS domain-containing protein